MRVSCHPTLHECLLYVVSHPFPWCVAELARRAGPVVRLPILGALVSDPDLAAAILQRDEDFTKAGTGTVAALVSQVLGPTALINMDGAAHRALRDRLRDLFSPACVRALSANAMTEALADLRQALTRGRTVDLVPFMSQLTGRVTCAMLGIAVADESAEALYTTIAALGQHLSAAVRFSAPPLPSRRVAELKACVDQLVAPAREAYASPHLPPDSIVARLRELGFTFDEAKGILATLLMVGTQTTSVALPRIVALLIDTGQWQLLREEPDLVQAAVDEGLRCVVPVPATIRAVARDVTIDGYDFRAGSRVFILTHNLAKAPDLFHWPERCDITRRRESRARHLWYGGGPHFCLGFALAQAELCAILQTLLSVPGDLRVSRRRYARKVMLPAYSQLEVRMVVG